jgi:two-component system OmpR family sensor kinase
MKRQQTLERQLAFWLALTIVGVALVAGSASFLLSFREANEIQDSTLRHIGALFNVSHLPSPQPDIGLRLTDEGSEARVIVSRLPTNAVSSNHPAGLRFPVDLINGMQTRMIQGKTYRIFVNTLGPGLRIAVAQQTAIRNESARNTALIAILPYLILMPVLLLVVARLVRTTLRPVAVLAARVDQRNESDLRPVGEATLPSEIQPFVVAIDRLLGRVAEAMSSQRRFIAAAAHELRTPLTALSFQAERLAAIDMHDNGQQRLADLRRGIERNRQLLDQLLTYARTEADVRVPRTEISVQAVIRHIFADLMPLVEAKRLDIGVEDEGDVQMVASAVELTVALKNIVGNAIKYTPEDGRITLAINETVDAVELVTEDNGPGIAESDRARVFEPFYRGLGTGTVGSGLGLSIVKNAVERMQGRIELSDARRSPTGLRVTLVIPKF